MNERIGTLIEDFKSQLVEDLLAHTLPWKGNISLEPKKHLKECKPGTHLDMVKLELDPNTGAFQATTNLKDEQDNVIEEFQEDFKRYEMNEMISIANTILEKEEDIEYAKPKKGDPSYDFDCYRNFIRRTKNRPEFFIREKIIERFLKPILPIKGPFIKEKTEEDGYRRYFNASQIILVNDNVYINFHRYKPRQCDFPFEREKMVNIEELNLDELIWIIGLAQFHAFIRTAIKDSEKEEKQ